MRKKIALALLTVALLLAGFAGGVYAVDQPVHQPVHGEKLVGFGPLGMKGEDTILKNSCMFRFTNPDCVRDITIERVSIIRGDGTLIYEGSYLFVKADGTRIPVSVLEPHRGGRIELWNWMRDKDGNWLSEDEARELAVARYTVEIEWTAKKGTCPLMGWGHETRITIIPGKPTQVVSYHIPMVNMRQRA